MIFILAATALAYSPIDSSSPLTDYPCMGGICPGDGTCCSIGCCPAVDAVCCDGQDFCCQKGETCYAGDPAHGIPSGCLLPPSAPGAAIEAAAVKPAMAVTPSVNAAVSKPAIALKPAIGLQPAIELKSVEKSVEKPVMAKDIPCAGGICVGDSVTCCDQPPFSPPNVCCPVKDATCCTLFYACCPPDMPKCIEGGSCASADGKVVADAAFLTAMHLA